MKKKIIRQKQTKLRKNFFPTLIITIIFWALLALLIYFVDPYSWGAVSAFFIILFFSLLFTFSIIFAHSRRGAVAAFGLTFFSVLRYFGIGNILNFTLIFGVCFAFEFYLSKR